MMQFPDDDLPELIFGYSRSQALEDGVLVAAPEQLCREYGIKYPLAFTRTLWDSIIVPDAESLAAGQSIEGRLADVLYLFALSARRTPGSVLLFKVRFLFGGKTHRDIALKSICGPGDTEAPCLTILFPDED